MEYFPFSNCDIFLNSKLDLFPFLVGIFFLFFIQIASLILFCKPTKNFSLFESPLNSNLQACILIQFQLKLTNTKNTNTTSNYKKHLYVSTRVSKINVLVGKSVFEIFFIFTAEKCMLVGKFLNFLDEKWMYVGGIFFQNK